MKLYEIDGYLAKEVRRKRWHKHDAIYFHSIYGWRETPRTTQMLRDDHVNYLVATQFMSDDWEEYHVAPFPCSPEGTNCYH